MPGHSSYRDTFLTACSELITPEGLFQILSRRLSEDPSNEGYTYALPCYLLPWILM